MSEISPIVRVGNPAISPAERMVRAEPASSTPTRQADQVELSDLAQLVSKYRALPDVRQELVDRVRSEIASGEYDSPDKVDAILNEVIQELPE